MSGELAVVGDAGRTPAEVRQWLAYVAEMTREVLEAGVDYGYLPRVEKPVLLKPGAEKLALLADLGVETVRVAWEPGPTGELGATYRATATRASGRQVSVERYAGYDENQFLKVGSNGELYFKATWDNVIAMAQKRAYVAAVKLALGLSGLFADLERGQENNTEDKVTARRDPNVSDKPPRSARPRATSRDRVPDSVYDSEPEAYR